jgi:hypothetical protein
VWSGRRARERRRIKRGERRSPLAALKWCPDQILFIKTIRPNSNKEN